MREFEWRKGRNPSYSLRAFASAIGIQSSKATEVLKGKKGLSAAAAERIAGKLKWSESETEFFVSLVESEHGRGSKNKEIARKKVDELSKREKFNEVSLDRFRIISDWFHFAILELTETKGFVSDVKWISQKLGIEKDIAERAIKRLIDSDLLVFKNGHFKQTLKNLATPSGIPSRAIKEHHVQILRKAEESLECDGVEERDFSTMTMPIDSSKLSEAKEMMKEFRRRFCKAQESTDQTDRVYCLSVQFFPLDKKLEEDR